MTEIKNGIYRHYKGGVYRVLMTAKHSETLEDMVVYVNTEDSSKCWVRPACMWNEEVKTTDGILKRFTFIKE